MGLKGGLISNAWLLTAFENTGKKEQQSSILEGNSRWRLTENGGRYIGKKKGSSASERVQKPLFAREWFLIGGRKG